MNKVLGILLVTLSSVVVSSCGSKKSSSSGSTLKVNVKAQGLANLTGATANALAMRALMVADPSTETDGYDGIGINYGESVVDGLKVKLTGVSMGGVPGSNDSTPNLSIFDWSAEPKEISIEDGLNEKLEQTVDVTTQEGTYKSMTVNLKNQYSIKAYAYLDTDNNGTIDTTIYTTANEVKKVAQKLTKANMTGYDYYHYNFALTGMADSVADGGDMNSITMFPNPIEITASNEVTTTEADGSTKTTKTAELSVDLAIDTYNLVKAWDGRYGNSTDFERGNASKIPYPAYPFPMSANDSRTLKNNLKSNDFFPVGTAAFGLGDYIPMFAFPNISGLKSQVYLVSKSTDFNPFNAQVFTIVTDTDGKPLIGKFSLGEGSQTLHIGQAARLFEKLSNGKYKFATSYGMKDANGNNDGGLFYNNDSAMAGHWFENFALLATVGDSDSMTMTNGPRCNGEYDYCVATAGVTAYYKRVK